MQPPVIPGHEFIGEVVKIGKGEVFTALMVGVGVLVMFPALISDGWYGVLVMFPALISDGWYGVLVMFTALISDGWYLVMFTALMVGIGYW